MQDVNVARVIGDCMIGALSEGPRRSSPPDVFLALSGMVRGIPTPVPHFGLDTQSRDPTLPPQVDGRFRLQLSDIFKLFQTGFDLPTSSFFLPSHVSCAHPSLCSVPGRSPLHLPHGEGGSFVSCRIQCC